MNNNNTIVEENRNRLVTKLDPSYEMSKIIIDYFNLYDVNGLALEDFNHPNVSIYYDEGNSEIIRMEQSPFADNDDISILTYKIVDDYRFMDLEKLETGEDKDKIMNDVNITELIPILVEEIVSCGSNISESSRWGEKRVFLNCIIRYLLEQNVNLDALVEDVLTVAKKDNAELTTLLSPFLKENHLSNITEQTRLELIANLELYIARHKINKLSLRKYLSLLVKANIDSSVDYLNNHHFDEYSEEIDSFVKDLLK